MIKLRILGSSLLMLAMAAACSAAGHESSAESEAVDAESDIVAREQGVPAEVISEVTYAGASYEFIDTGDAVMVQVSGELAQGEPALAALQRQQPDGLTMLEIYLALASDDAVPDERLVAAHVAEAQALGRVDGSVLRVELSEDQLLEKKAVGDCKAVVLALAGPNSNATTNTGNAELATGQTSTKMAAALCNDADAVGNSIKVEFFRKRTTDAGWVLINPGAQVNPGAFSALVGSAVPFLRQMKVKGTPPGGNREQYFLAVAY